MTVSRESGEVDATTELLDQRYGQGKRRQFDKRFGWIAGSLLVLAGLTLFIFSGWQQTASVEVKVLSNNVLDERTVTLDMQVTLPANSHGFCALEALSESHAVVGWKVIELAPSDQRTRRTLETLVTTAPATTGSVRSCWLAAA